jgi:hypothetical protein
VVALRATHVYLRRQQMGDFAVGAIMFVAFFDLFIGAWLPVGLMLVGRGSIRERPGMSQRNADQRGCRPDATQATWLATTQPA